MTSTHLQRIIGVSILLFTATFVKGQAVITEYFYPSETFKLNLNERKTIKAVYVKGVLDIDWNAEKRTLAISYDPKMTDIDPIMASIKVVTADNAMSANTPQGTKKSGDE